MLFLSSNLCSKGSCLCWCSQCKCSLISGNQSDLPRLITMFSARQSLRWRNQCLTNTLKYFLSFSGGISSPEVIRCGYVGGFFVFLHASPIDFNKADITVWPQSKNQGRHDLTFFFRFDENYFKKKEKDIQRMTYSALRDELTFFPLKGKILFSL